MNILDIFNGFERTIFPESECTIPNAREPDVKDSDSVYLCVVVDDRFPHQFEVMFLHPYTAVDCEDGSTLYGWTRMDRNNYVDHCMRAIHCDHERVVAWKKVDAAVDVRNMFGVPHVK